MSYSIYIGEKVWVDNNQPKTIDWCGLQIPNPDYEYIESGFEVLRVEYEAAPSFPNDEMTGKSNSRYPGTIQWDNFIEEVNLETWFFHKERGLMRTGGCFDLNMYDGIEINQALKKYQRQYPNVEPGFCGCDIIDYNDETDCRICGFGDVSACFARLLWLEWWVVMALENCKHPAIYNH